MNIEPKEDDWNKLMEALALLADLVSRGIRPDKAASDEIIQKVDLNNKHDWALDKLKLAYPILERAYRDIHDIEKDMIIKELEALGVKKFPAIFTIERAKPQPFAVEPRLISFGLKLGEEANTTLTVTGGIVKEASAGKHLDIHIYPGKNGSTLIKVKASGGSAGESLQDYIIIKGDKGELKVPVNVQWEKSTEKPIMRAIEKSIPVENEPPFLSWCPICAPKIHRKTLLYSKAQRKFRCSQCEHEFPYPDKRVSDYNNSHP